MGLQWVRGQSGFKCSQRAIIIDSTLDDQCMGQTQPSASAGGHWAS